MILVSKLLIFFQIEEITIGGQQLEEESGICKVTFDIPKRSTHFTATARYTNNSFF